VCVTSHLMLCMHDASVAAICHTRYLALFALEQELCSLVIAVPAAIMVPLQPCFFPAAVGPTAPPASQQ
jgi:hypothetical protein